MDEPRSDPPARGLVDHVCMRHLDVAERRRRLAVRHGLAGAVALDPAQVARRLVALHASDPATVYLSVQARSGTAVTAAAVEESLYERRDLVRMLAMRRAGFVVPAESVPGVRASTPGKIAQGQRAIAHQHLRQRAVDPARHQGGHRTTRGGLVQIIVTVHPLALDRDKQLARLQLAGIDGNPGGLGVDAQQPTMGPDGNGAQPHHARGSRAIRSSAACATARSSNGCLPVAPSW